MYCSRLLMQQTVDNNLFDMHILSLLALQKKVECLTLFCPASVCVLSLSVKSPFSPCLSLTLTRRLTMAGISKFPLPLLIYLSLWLSVFPGFSHSRPYRLLNLPSFLRCRLFPRSHKAISCVSLDVYIIEAFAHEGLNSESKSLVCASPLPPTLLSPNTAYSLLFMELFHHVFLHAYYRGLLYASSMAPMKHLNYLSPPVCLATLKKVFPTKSQNYSCCICILSNLSFAPCCILLGASSHLPTIGGNFHLHLRLLNCCLNSYKKKLLYKKGIGPTFSKLCVGV